MREYRFLFLLFAFLLTACREQSDYYFYDDGSWRVKDALTIDKALLDIGLGLGGQILGEEFGIELPNSALDSGHWIELAYGLMTDELKRQGYDASWANNGQTYTIQIEGYNYPQFCLLGRGLFVIDPMGDGSYHLYMDVNGMVAQFGIPEMALSGLSGMFDYEREVHLHARKIISSNADEVHGGRATWYGIRNLDVIFIPLSHFSLDGLLFVVAGLFVLTAVISTVVSVVRRGSPCPECGKRVRKGQEICPYCGAYMASYDDITRDS